MVREILWSVSLQVCDGDEGEFMVVIHLEIRWIGCLGYVKTSADYEDKSFNPIFRYKLMDLRMKDFSMLIHKGLNIALKDKHGISLIKLVLHQEMGIRRYLPSGPQFQSPRGTLYPHASIASVHQARQVHPLCHRKSHCTQQTD